MPARRRVLARATIAALVGAVVVLVVLEPLTRTRVTLGPSTVEVAAAMDRHGGTEIEIPPLGRVSARTHDTPVRLSVTLVELDIEDVQSTFGTSLSSDTVRQAIEADLPGAVDEVLRRALLVAALVGAVAAAVPPGRRWWHLAIGAAAGVVVVAAALGATWRSFDESAFAQPRFTGALERAPAVVEAVQRNVEGLDEVRDRVETLSAQLDDLFAAATGASPLDDGADTTILHTSDIHSNPLAVQLVNDLAEAFAVDAVLDTGDLTSFGATIESRLGDLIEVSPVPWYTVPGNHDSAANRRQLARVEGLTVLDGDVVDIGGVRVLGIADPTFTADNRINATEAAATKRAAGAAVASATARAAPDVLAVHDLVLAEAVDGDDVALIVAGHIHRRTAAVDGAIRRLTVGSSGSSGLGSFTVDTAVAYEAQLLRFDDGVLVAIDYVSVTDLGGGFTVERTLVEAAEVDEGDEEGDGVDADGDDEDGEGDQGDDDETEG